MKLPLEYRWLKANGFKGFIPWYLIEQLGKEALRSEYQNETGKDFYPFAQRQDCDDVAGFEVINGAILTKVITVHLTWSGKNERNGFPSCAEFDDMYDWIKKEVIPATLDWMSEEDLDELQSNA